MIEWWGPILFEYYAGTEGTGRDLHHQRGLAEAPGIGRHAPASGSILHVCDEDGERPAARRGGPDLLRARDGRRSSTTTTRTRRAPARHPQHPNWNALGDVGYLDEEGYLYLTDRQAFMIISGGVNIYPQAIEDALITHPKVGDVAVFGVPDAEMGEAVKAVIEPAPGLRIPATRWRPN